MDADFVDELNVALRRLDLEFALSEISREEWVDRHDSLLAWLEARGAAGAGAAANLRGSGSPRPRMTRSGTFLSLELRAHYQYRARTAH
jgi:hypothetical protein